MTPCTISPKPGTAPRFPRELDDRGNVEYKYQLLSPSADRVLHLQTQMRWRVEEGSGSALYRVGVKDDGSAVGLSVEDLTQSLSTLCEQVAQPLGLVCDVGEFLPGSSPDRVFASVAISQPAPAAGRPARQLRVAVVGPSGSGKSSLIAVLVNARLRDDGKGKARRFVAQHKHELQQGCTSSFSLHCLGSRHTDDDSLVANVFCSMTVTEGWDKGEDAVVLLDTPGAERFLGTTLRCLASLQPDCLLICQAKDPDQDDGGGGWFGQLARDMRLPFVVVYTKADVTPSAQVSAVTGHGLDELAGQLRRLRSKPYSPSPVSVLTVCQRFDFDEDDDEDEDGDGDKLVVGGLVQSGSFRVGDRVVVGPTADGRFVSTAVVSLRAANGKNAQVVAGSTAGMCLGSGRELLRLSRIATGLMVTNHPKATLVWTITVTLAASPLLSLHQLVGVYTGAVHQPARVVRLAFPLATLHFARKQECSQAMAPTVLLLLPNAVVAVSSLL